MSVTHLCGPPGARGPAPLCLCPTKSGETHGRELGWTVFFLSRSMAACPVLGLAALLCLSAPQASSVVQYRRPVHVVLLEPQGRDCSHIWMQRPRAPSGVYTVQPEGASTPFEVLCDMRPDGGWTVIQSRDQGQGTPLDFERCWQEYKQGFGDLRGDHWLGLDHISSLTSQPGLRSELRVDLLDADNHTLQAHYDDFRVGREEQFYPLTLGRYSGNAGDAFRGLGHTDNQEGCGFSTLDRDHDRCSPCVDGAQTFTSCSHDRSGAGWWYSTCGRADLNGLWPEQAGAASGMRWAAGDHQPALRASVLRVHTTASGKV
ncbi:angiopoietin-related protein 5-like isoform X1 [Mustela lutreola]|uniref:angiopoietin-related protein 5-like isoform X1 n=1 Tax=Mustela lutreola TaxID=9666 RepID=UPI0027970BD8|nr:angiopoietin-related protein 5-like isoform X1 [Mustela lutreola]